MKRKRICLVTISPEYEYSQRVMAGVFSQCQKYGYDVAVVTAMVSVCNYYKDYLQGEINIYKLINPDLFDGFIITPIPMMEDNNLFLYNDLLDFFKKCSKPVVSIDEAFGDYPVVYTNDKNSFYHITEHLIKEHNCKKIDILGASDNSTLTQMRVQGILDALKDNNIDFDENRLFRGDYWYSGGERLANRYISNELVLPDAVVCLSDHMAIGLVNQLIKNDIKVPDDLIVTGFGAVHEAAKNTPSITSCVPSHKETGITAVEYLHALFEGEDSAQNDSRASSQPSQPLQSSSQYSSYSDFAPRLKIGMTCGCPEDFSYTRGTMLDEIQGLKYNYNDKTIWNHINMTMLQESYMAEILTAAENPQQCMEKIYESKYLLKPYKFFYVCLNEDWLNTDSKILNGYSKRMMLAISAEDRTKTHGYPYHVFFGDGNEKFFSSDSMLPAFDEEFVEPQVFYFAPLHFGNASLGYAVLQNPLSNPGYVGEVYRNYLRNINNALEMSRTKYRATYLAQHDSMTGLRNRRGLEVFFAVKMKYAADKDKIFAVVVDMDDLKKRNDLYGHSEGDRGISLVANAVRSITSGSEVCVRGGGDEFFILGIGDYSEEMMAEKVSNFEAYLETANEVMDIPVSASIGYSLKTFDKAEGFQVVLDRADAKMYENKKLKKAGKK